MFIRKWDECNIQGIRYFYLSLDFFSGIVLFFSYRYVRFRQMLKTYANGRNKGKCLVVTHLRAAIEKDIPKNV